MLIFVLILSCFCLTFSLKKQTNPLFSFDGVDKVCLISSLNFQEKNIEDMQTVVCGDVYFNYCSLSVAKNNLDVLNKNIKGIQFYLSDVGIEDIIARVNGQIVETSQVGDLKIYYAYSPYYDDCVFVNDKKINMQIAEKEEKIVVGFPLILTGY